MNRRAKPATPAGLPVAQEPCQITFGHNLHDGLVTMIFSIPASQLIFTPQDAEDVARKLRHYAEAARGKKPA